MEYKLPPLPDPKTYWFDTYQGPQSISSFNEGDMRQYAEQAVSPLLAEIERLKRGEFICYKCGLRKDAETGKPDF